MTEKAWRTIFIVGSLLSFLVLIGLSINSLNQVVASRTSSVTTFVAAGKKVWQQRDCNDCHTILGIGGYYAPDLTQVIRTRGDTWLASWLTNPQAVNAAAQMPNQNLSAGQVQDLVAFFTWVGDIDTNGWPPQPIGNPSGAAGASGSVLFEQKGCPGCHMVNGQGGTFGPDLSHIATTPYDALSNSPDFLKKWLADPAAQKPGTAMPNLSLSQAEIDTLVQYLATLK